MDDIKTISVRFTDKEYSDLMSFCDSYRARTGVQVSRHSIIKMIMHYGINACCEAQIYHSGFPVLDEEHQPPAN